MTPQPVVTSATLAWGRRYAMVRPDHFRVDYVINPYMDVAAQPEPCRAGRQWQRPGRHARRLGAEVEVIEQPADAPDMVYAMNLGLALTDSHGPRVALSHMRFPQRPHRERPRARLVRRRTASSPPAWARPGWVPTSRPATPSRSPARWSSAHGPRTEELALKHLAKDFDIACVASASPTRGCTTSTWRSARSTRATALVCPAAFDPESAAAVLALVPDPIVPQRGGGAHVLRQLGGGRPHRRDAVLPRPGPPRDRRPRSAVEVVDVSEFHKGGGSVRCMTNPLDIVDRPRPRPGAGWRL